MAVIPMMSVSYNRSIITIDICVIQQEYHSNDICSIQHEYHGNKPIDICINMEPSISRIHMLHDTDIDRIGITYI